MGHIAIRVWFGFGNERDAFTKADTCDEFGHPIDST